MSCLHHKGQSMSNLFAVNRSTYKDEVDQHWLEGWSWRASCVHHVGSSNWTWSVGIRYSWKQVHRKSCQNRSPKKKLSCLINKVNCQYLAHVPDAERKYWWQGNVFSMSEKDQVFIWAQHKKYCCIHKVVLTGSINNNCQNKTSVGTMSRKQKRESAQKSETKIEKRRK